MIELVRGNLLEADADALVNTVNTAGVMGRGIAFQFKRAFPANYEAYRAACKRGEVVPGQMFIHPTGQLHGPRYIVNFPTKRHWKSKSRLEDVREGLEALAADIRRLELRSVAVPPLGCGLGGLAWDQVLPLIHEHLGSLQDVRVLVYEPRGAPAPEAMPTRTERPSLSRSTAILLGLIEQYRVPRYEDDATLLEAHKLLYFQQAAGEDLGLDYERGPYGPYATNLRHLLQRIEGHYVTGYGDATDRPDCPLRPVAEHLAEAEQIRAQDPDTQRRFARVAQLIEGFETPFGLELLATTHYVVATEPEPPKAAEVPPLVHAWSPRKARIFPADMIQAAYQRLCDEGWIQPG